MHQAPDPCLVIEIDFDSKVPIVFIVASTEEQESRIVDWIESQDELSELVGHALDLRREAA